VKIVNSTLAALRAVRVNKLRSALTMLGIVLGVSSVIIMMAVGRGASDRINADMRALGTNLLILNSGAQKTAGVTNPAGSKPSVTLADVEAINQEALSIRSAAPQHSGTRQLIFGNLNWSTKVMGTTAEYLRVREWEVVNGRAFTLEEVTNAEKVVLVGQTVVKKLFPDQNPVGEEIRVNHVPMTIIGELAPKGQSLAGIDMDDTALIPITTALNRVLGRHPANSRAIAGAAIKVKENINMITAFEEIRQVLRSRHGLTAPDDPDDFHLVNLAEVMKAREESAKALGTLLAAIAGVSLLVGGIGIMNIMLVSITERTREIGLRLAVGARRSDILSQFMIEAITLSLIGGVVGLALGLTGALAVEHYANLGVVLDGRLSVIAMGFAAAVGVFFGFYPARKASRLQPVEALRYE
jgi:putative ABC transport system permease protein